GDAFAAGRLIEQASSTGVSQVLVAGTLDAFSNRAPGTGAIGTPAAEDASTVAATVAGAASVDDPVSAPPEVAVADYEAAQTAEANDVVAAPAAETKETAADLKEPAAGTIESAADTTAPAAEIEETAAEIEETGAEIEETAAANSSGNEASAAAVATLAGAAAVAAIVENESVSAGASGPDLVARDAGTAAAATAPTAPPEAAAERSETARAPDTVATAESATISAADAPGDADALAASAESDVLAAEDSAGGELDALVTSATGLALGALSVELIVNSESAALPDAPAAPAGNLVVSNPSLEPAYAAESLEGRVRDAMAPLLDEPAAPSADSLPDGFADEDALAFDARPASYDVSNDLEAMAAGAAASSGPRFYPFSELTTTFQEPLTYPRRTIDAGDGFVDVEFSVNERGRVDDLVVLGDPPPVFARSASRTLRRWRFEPVLINGEPVTVRTGLRITYRNPF
ncbi:MAG: energy transducer TonB, partial [Pseudomonadota bacterium]